MAVTEYSPTQGSKVCNATLAKACLAVRSYAGVLRVALRLALVVTLWAASASSQKTGIARSHVNPQHQAQSPFLEAESLLSQGSVAEAKHKTLETLQLHPDNVEGYNLLGIICTDERDYAAALEAFQHALKLDANSTRTRNNLGKLYVAQDKTDLAENEFRAVLHLDPANRDGSYNLGLLLLAKNRPREAIPHFERVRPQNDESRLNLIRAYLQSGRTAEGRKLAGVLSSQQKNNIQFHFTLGLLLASAKEYRDAQLELEEADALQPGTLEILFNLGQVYFREGEYSKAEVILNRALKLKPESPEILCLTAQVLVDQSRPVEALELLMRAHNLAPQNTDAIFLLARVSMMQNYFEDAIPLLESGLKVAPQRADLHAALGESYFMSGKAEKAIDEFKNLVALDPTARSYVFLGLSYRHLGRFDEARKYFQEGLKLDAHNASCLFNLGYIEERQGNDAAAEKLFQQSLQSNPDLSDALLELANLRIAKKEFVEAAVLLRRFVKVSRDPATGYYKLAMVERSLHQTAAAQRDLSVFQTLSKSTSTGPYPYQHLFDYLENRSKLPPQARTQLDQTELIAQLEKRPDEPQNLYMLAESYLKLGKREEARNAVARFDKLSGDDYRSQTGIGVLLARYRLYDDAIEHFQTALRANPESDDVKFDLAGAQFRKAQYAEALETIQRISPPGQQDDATLALLGDIYAHLGDTARALQIFRSAISRNPDNDQYYLSLALIQLRQNDAAGAAQTLQSGLKRTPASGKIQWGLGLVSALEGKTGLAAERLERALELLPEWPGSYSTLGVFYYQTGQIEKAREVLNRFKGSNVGGLDISRIEDVLSRAPATPSSAAAPMSPQARQQLLQLALSLADRTL